MTASVDVDVALRLLRRVPRHLHVVGPATPERIQAAEQALGVTFPPSYRRFLGELGAGSILGREVYGVVPDISAAGPPNVVWMNLDRRQAESLPDHFVVLVDLDDSSSYALDTAGDGGESPVVRIWPGEPVQTLVDSQVAPSFGSFFHRFTQERIATLQ
jgi:antitoxin YobK